MQPGDIATKTLIDAQQIVQTVALWENLAVGAVTLFVMLWINVFFQRRISLAYEIRARINLYRQRYNLVFLNYFVSIIGLIMVQTLAIAVWALMLRVMGLIDDPLDAILFAGSCYTTIGIVSDVMPPGWKLLALFIALSGLFSIACFISSSIFSFRFSSERRITSIFGFVTGCFATKIVQQSSNGWMDVS